MSEQATQEAKTPSTNKINWRELEVGAIWDYGERLVIKIKNKEGKDVRMVCFKNKFKDPNNRDDDRLPAWRVYKDNKDYNPTAAAQTPKKTTTKAVEKAPAPEQNQEEFV